MVAWREYLSSTGPGTTEEAAQVAKISLSVNKTKKIWTEATRY